MSWDFNYWAGPNGAIEDLAPYLTDIRVQTEQSAPPRHVDIVVGHLPGVQERIVEFDGPGQLVLKGEVRDTDGAGAVTHLNGRAGHLEQNRIEIRRLFKATRRPHILRREIPTDPVDTVRLFFRPGQITFGTGAERNTIHIPLRTIWPYWRSSIDRTTLVNGTTVIPVVGDAPMSDMTLAFSGPGVFTHVNSGEHIEILAGAGPTIVNCDTRRILTDPGGLLNDNYFLPSTPAWQYWPREAAGVTVTSTVDVTVTWRDQYQT